MTIELDGEIRQARNVDETEAVTFAVNYGSDNRQGRVRTASIACLAIDNNRVRCPNRDSEFDGKAKGYLGYLTGL